MQEENKKEEEGEEGGGRGGEEKKVLFRTMYNSEKLAIPQMLNRRGMDDGIFMRNIINY